MFKELKKNMFKELKASMITMTHQIENAKKEIEIFNKNQMDISR
jgi:hypothetical protein